MPRVNSSQSLKLTVPTITSRRHECYLILVAFYILVESTLSPDGSRIQAGRRPWVQANDFLGLGNACQNNEQAHTMRGLQRGFAAPPVRAAEPQRVTNF